MSNFKRYQSLSKLGNIECEGILDGLVSIFPKLDGTNAQVWMENGEIMCGSRNRTLSLENDNQGFMAYVMSDDGYKIRKVLSFFPSIRLYGEWLVPHSFKEYRDDAWRKFYIFDMETADGNFIKYDDWVGVANDYELDYIPEVLKINFPTLTDLNFHLNKSTFLCKEGVTQGEGIVLKNYHYRNARNECTHAKIISNEFKELHLKAMGSNIVEGSKQVEVELVTKGVTSSLIEKEKAKLGEWDKKKTAHLLGIVYYALLTEEMPSMLYKMKQPIVDFRRLQKLTYDKVLIHLGIK